MCGRYALNLRPAEIRRMLEADNMPVYEAPPDPPDEEDEEGREYGGGGGGGAGYDGNDAAPIPMPRPRQSYNFAPGYHGVVYRADVPDRGAGPSRRRHHHHRSDGEQEEEEEEEERVDDSAAAAAAAEGDDGGGGGKVRYKLQAMKWGLVPFWTKRNPGFGSVMKTINCRDDSLAQSGGMWSSMKARKRCVVVAQGFYEWLKKGEGSKAEKIPHFVKRRDGRLMCFAGLWDVVQYENDEDNRKQYTYTIITTDSNKQLSFLHDRMPVILENGSDALRTWLDPKRHEWSKELQSLLKPYEGELDVYPVSKDVGKVGNNSPSFIIPINSKENKNNIANFFAKGAATSKTKGGAKKEEKPSSPASVKEEVKQENDMLKHGNNQPEVEVKKEEGFVAEGDSKDSEKGLGASQSDMSTTTAAAGIKREAEDDDDGAAERDLPKKKEPKIVASPAKATSPMKGGARGRPKISATSNGTKSPKKPKEAGTQKITKFFANSS